MSVSDIDSVVASWKTKLLDLSKRNRAINFKPTRASTVEITDIRSADLLRQLAVGGPPIRFRATAREEPDGRAIGDDDFEMEFDEFGAESDAEYELAQFLADDGTVKQRAGYLNAPLTPSRLDHNLRRIEQLARLSIEEQGLNTLHLALGFLEYYETETSEVPLRAPLVLVPVDLKRRTDGAGFALKPDDDDPISNPALAEYLRGAYGLILPEIPDLDDAPDFDLNAHFGKITNAVKVKPRWRVVDAAFLGLFSFEKLVMYEDLERNASVLSRHPVIRQIVTRSNDIQRDLPDEVRALDIDADYPPERQAHVVDADSSQLRALAAVDRGYSLIVVGPPGTGKSQTITNMIASAISAGKSVLFVAEKQAALNVVYDRLRECGLGEFCLPLHSTSANKKAVLEQIRIAWDQTIQREDETRLSAQQLPGVRDSLNQYVADLKTPFGAGGYSPYAAYSEIARYAAAPALWLSLDAKSLSRVDVEAAVGVLAQLAASAEGIGVPSENPWRDSRNETFSRETLDQIAKAASAARTALKAFTAAADKVRAELGVPEIGSLEATRDVVAFAAVLARSPGAPKSVLVGEPWLKAPIEAVEMIKRGRKTVERGQFQRQRFRDEVLDIDYRPDFIHMERLKLSWKRHFPFLDPQAREIITRWRSYVISGPKDLPTLNKDIASMDRYARERNVLMKQAVRGRELFGELWQGEESDWDALDAYLEWMVEYRTLCQSLALPPDTVARAAEANPRVPSVDAFREAADKLDGALQALESQGGWVAGALRSEPLSVLANRLSGLVARPADAYAWGTYGRAYRAASAGPTADIAKLCHEGKLAFGTATDAFRRGYFARLIEQAMAEREGLREFNALTHEQKIARFRQLDRDVLLENRAGIINRTRAAVEAKLLDVDVREAVAYLQNQIGLTRKRPLLQTMKKAGGAIRAIKPCFMMSPMTVAQLLNAENDPFDLVIFDEASQLPTEDAVGAIARGKQVVVAGDPFQLPPTNFFAVSAGLVSAERDTDSSLIYEDGESLLEVMASSGFASSLLKWHYRSKAESLITFNNVDVYDGDLLTFPSALKDGDRFGLSFVKVGGSYDKGGLNLAEAKAVADAVVVHIQTRPNVSLGVGTFNLRQQMAILDELELRRRRLPEIEPFFDRARPRPFFVKNLENIQGDERDVIFLSITYGPDADGTMRQNFGPLNRENGWRRLNVLTSRAVQQMTVFSSMTGDDIRIVPEQEGRKSGPNLLRRFLHYAERRVIDRSAARLAALDDAPFENDVACAIRSLGYEAVPRVGEAGYRIDIGVIDPTAPDRYVCGIECDGVGYYASESARDRDRLRAQVLEDRNWRIYRIWSTDWFRDREGQIARLKSRLAEVAAVAG